MKRLLVLLSLICILGGCAGDDQNLRMALSLREKALVSDAAFVTQITAHGQNGKQSFTLACTASRDGSVGFTVVEPEVISSIQGTLSASGGALTFDDKALSFSMLADGQLSPVSAPWILHRAIQGGSIHACGSEDELIRLTVYDSYEDDALMLDIWFAGESLSPHYAEVYWRERLVLSMTIENFRFL